jgi:Flp pilus assembly protein TadG
MQPRWAIRSGTVTPKEVLESERGNLDPMSAINGVLPCNGRAAEVQSISGRRRRAKSSREEGSALVETALVLPIICLLMTGIFSFSIALYQKLELAHGVASGARFLAADRGDTDPCDATAQKVYASAPTLAQSSINMTFVLNGTSYTGKTCSGTTNLVSGTTAQITATYPCSVSVYGMTFGSCTLTESITEVVQ